IPTVIDGEATPCVQLDRTEPQEEGDEPVETRLHVVAADEETGDEPVSVSAGHGAVVRQDGGGDQGAWMVIDERGTLYQVPPGHREVLELLGYGEGEPPPVPGAWAGLFPPGPVLTVEDAQSGLPPEALQDMDEHVDEP